MRGFVVGILASTALVLGYAHLSTAETVPTFGEVKDRPASELAAAPGECLVQMDYGRLTPGNRCGWSDEVVTGAQQGYLLCSRVRVICPTTP